MKRYKKAQQAGNVKMQEELLKLIQEHDDIYEMAVDQVESEDPQQWLSEFMFNNIDSPFRFKEMDKKYPDTPKKKKRETSWFTRVFGKRPNSRPPPPKSRQKKRANSK